jgi:hypothetical protein
MDDYAIWTQPDLEAGGYYSEVTHRDDDTRVLYMTQTQRTAVDAEAIARHWIARKIGAAPDA